MNKHTRQAKGPDGTCGFRRARGMGPPTTSSMMGTSPTSNATNGRMMFATRKKKEKTMDEALNQALTREVQILRRDNERLRIENDELRTSQHRNESTKQTQWHVEAVKSLTEKLNETVELLNAEKQRSERLEAEVIRLKRILERFSSSASPSSTSSNYLRSSPTTTSSSPSSPTRFCLEEEAMEEAESLESIYGEGFMRYSDGSYRITIPVVKTSRSSALWSLLCRPTRGYPSSSPMQFSIESSGPHNIQAHELNRVKGDMMSQYCPGEVAVFGWVEHLKSALHALVNTKRTVAW